MCDRSEDRSEEDRSEAIVVAKKPVKRRRRKIDVDATLAKYALRIRLLEDGVFQELEDAWVSTFHVYSSLSWPWSFVPPRMRCNATVLVEEAARRGVHVLGITSERKTKGSYICDKLPMQCDEEEVEVLRSEARTVYVGQYSYFTGNTSHPTFSVKPCDKVRMP